MHAAGILTTDGNVNSLMLLTDGEETPAKYEFSQGFDKQTLKGIFSVGRVQVTYSKNGPIRTLLSIKKEPQAATGTVTGTVVLIGNNAFWIAIKLPNGLRDGFAGNWPPGEVSAKLKTLRKGDTVKIKFHTDFERHRIDAMEVQPMQGNPPTPNAVRPPSPPPPKVPDGVVAIRDVEYAKVGDKSLLLDIYKPAVPAGKLPLVVWIHGGAWRGGSKNFCPQLHLTERGYIVASIDYRLSQEAIFPAQIEDCKAAIRFLRANAAKYSINPDRIGVAGDSAGGHLVALLGASNSVKDVEGKVGNNLNTSSAVQCVVDFYGPTDMMKFKGQPVWPKTDDPKSPLCQLIGGPLAEKQELVAKANPITYVSKNAPPFLIIHGNADNTVPFNQSELLVAALKQAGTDVTFEVVKNGGHGFNAEQSQRLKPIVEAFFEKNLKSPVSPQPASEKTTN